MLRTGVQRKCSNTANRLDSFDSTDVAKFARAPTARSFAPSASDKREALYIVPLGCDVAFLFPCYTYCCCITCLNSLLSKHIITTSKYDFQYVRDSDASWRLYQSQNDCGSDKGHESSYQDCMYLGSSLLVRRGYCHSHGW